MVLKNIGHSIKESMSKVIYNWTRMLFCTSWNCYNHQIYVNFSVFLFCQIKFQISFSANTSVYYSFVAVLMLWFIYVELYDICKQLEVPWKPTKFVRTPRYGVFIQMFFYSLATFKAKNQPNHFRWGTFGFSV